MANQSNTLPLLNNTGLASANTGNAGNTSRIAPNNAIKIANNTKPINTPKPANNSQPNTIIANNKSVSTNVNTNLSKKMLGPKINSIKKEMAIENLNNSLKGSAENIKTTDQEMIEYGNVITSNYLLLVGISTALILCILIYYFSSSYRVGRTVELMLRYQNFQRITSIEYDKFGSIKLSNMFIESAYNASHSGLQMYDYTSEKIVLSILQSGARYLEFNIFNSEFGSNAFPVVSMGYKTGEWKMMITDTPLETIFQTIADNAFAVSEGSGGVNNPEDPLFIGLNLNTNSNLNCLNLISYLILKYFKGRFLESNYTYQNEGNLANITLIELMGKVIFFSSDGFQGSGLEEIINCCWDNVNADPIPKMQRIHYSALTAKSFDPIQMIEYNKTGLTIIVPHNEGDILNTNYDTITAFETGCHFVSMEFQYINNYMDSYITRFKNKSLIQKNKDLQSAN